MIRRILILIFLPISLFGQNRPNIIFILTDDHHWDALGFAGNNIIQTPEMDKLAREGVYYENAFVTTPICAASRASFLTGLYERTHRYTFVYRYQKPAPEENGGPGQRILTVKNI